MSIGAAMAIVVIIIVAAAGVYVLDTSTGKSSLTTSSLASTTQTSTSTTTQSTVTSDQSSSSTASVCVAGDTKSYQDTIRLTYGLIATGLWNLRSASGDVRMCYQPSGIHATVDLMNVTAGLVQPGDFVGYPEVAYGFSAGDTPFGQMDSNLTFPIKLDAFAALSLSSSVTYFVAAPRTQPLDFAYDLWIEGNPQPDHGASSTDLELMIWLDNQTFGGPGSQVGLFSTPAMINGSGIDNSTWGVHVSMPTTQLPHELVVYLSTHPMKAGSVSIQISNFIEDAIAHYWHLPSNMQSYYLMGIELGSEFAAPSRSASYDWGITDMVLQEPGLSITLVG